MKRRDVPEVSRLPRLLSVRACAEMTTLPAGTLYHLAATGQLSAVRIGRSVRIDEDDLRRWIESRREMAR